MDRQAITIGNCVATRAVTHNPVLSGMLQAISSALLVPSHAPLPPAIRQVGAANQLPRDNVTIAAACLNNDERRLLRSQFLQSKWFISGGEGPYVGHKIFGKQIHEFAPCTIAKFFTMMNMLVKHADWPWYTSESVAPCMRPCWCIKALFSLVHHIRSHCLQLQTTSQTIPDSGHCIQSC